MPRTCPNTQSRSSQTAAMDSNHSTPTSKNISKELEGMVVCGKPRPGPSVSLQPFNLISSRHVEAYQRQLRGCRVTLAATLRHKCFPAIGRRSDTVLYHSDLLKTLCLTCLCSAGWLICWLALVVEHADPTPIDCLYWNNLSSCIYSSSFTTSVYATVQGFPDTLEALFLVSGQSHNSKFPRKPETDSF